MNAKNNVKPAGSIETQELESLIAQSNSIFGYLRIGFGNGQSSLILLGYVLAILLALLLFYCGYQFFTASPEKEVFWGVCFVICFQAQVATKLWIYMQTNTLFLSKQLRILLAQQK